MSPSRAGLSHSSSWRIFSSVRLVTFFTSAWNWKLAKNELKFTFIINLFWKWLICVSKSYHSTLKTPFVLHKFKHKLKKMSMKLIWIMVQKQNWEISYEFSIFWHTYCQHCQLGFSSKTKVPQLGSARNLHSSSSLEPENSSSNSSLQTTFFAKNMNEGTSQLAVEVFICTVILKSLVWKI